MKTYCEKCGKPLGSFITTAYGDIRCEDCYDDYLMTDKGKVEYFIGLCTGELDMKDYDVDFLGEVVCSWKENRGMLFMSVDTIFDIEDRAKAIGLL